MGRKPKKKVPDSVPTPIRKFRHETLPDVTVPEGMELLRVPLDLIRRFPGQPRQTFNFDELKLLGRSIQEFGQLTPVMLRPIQHERYHFELIDGERRFRACQLFNIATILAFVKVVDSKEVQYRESVAANFNRANHTYMEIAHGIQKMEKDLVQKNGDSENAIQKIALIFGRDPTWVYQYRSLLRLCPAVQELMEEGKIPFQIGVSLANLLPGKQLEAARRIIGDNLDLKEALHYVRIQRSDPDNRAPTGRMRGPSDDYYRLERFLTSLERDLKITLDMPSLRSKAMFRNRSAEDLSHAAALVKHAIASLTRLQDVLAKTRDMPMSPPAPAVLPGSSRQAALA